MPEKIVLEQDKNIKTKEVERPVEIGRAHV